MVLTVDSDIYFIVSNRFILLRINVLILCVTIKLLFISHIFCMSLSTNLTDTVVRLQSVFCGYLYTKGRSKEKWIENNFSKYTLGEGALCFISDTITYLTRLEFNISALAQDNWKLCDHFLVKWFGSLFTISRFNILHTNSTTRLAAIKMLCKIFKIQQVQRHPVDISSVIIY